MSGAQGALSKESKTTTVHESVQEGENKSKTDLKSKGPIQVDSGNNLQGEIPPSLGKCGKLNKLYISNNNLSGSIPSEIGGLSSLSVGLDLSSNRLTGLLPFELGKLINLGSILVFSIIFLCWSRKKRKLSASTNEENPLRSFLAECEALRNVRHRNMVKVLIACSGVDCGGNDFKALVYEFMANGSLEDWLHPPVGINDGEEAAKSLNLFQRLNMAIDVGCALEYLHHHCEMPLIHSDLKPSNILLDDEMVGHVGDFGLAKFITLDLQNHTSSSSISSSLGFRGTIGYVPPEYGLESSVTTYGDVYSYGVLLLEMFIGRRPTDEMFKENLNLYSFVKTTLPNHMAEITDPIILQESFRQETRTSNTFNERNQKENTLIWGLTSIFEIGVACSSELPIERMNMTNVVAQLCSIMDKLFPTRSVRKRGTNFEQ
ncbi:hypothetical protein PTKIN_Ptkin16aG0538000 [Pterospermum kingtungense]